MDKMNAAPTSRRRGLRRGALTLGMAVVVTGLVSLPGRGSGAVSAQAFNPCALLVTEEIEPLLPKNTSAPVGVSNSMPEFGQAVCQYTWGAGIDRFRLSVSVGDASRMFAGATPEQARQRLLESVKAGTNDAVISEVGEAAVFKPGSSAHATATAFVKGRVLHVGLDGRDARDRKDQIIGLLKAAALRL